ncbi:MAG: DUF2652 domain-containing protein [Gammaproteobacteria bacterium]
MSSKFGYFVIADISGYTKYLASNELEHAQGILGEMTSLLIEELSQPFRFIELEGDAVFVFAPDAAVENAERLLDIVESCYVSFRLLREQMVNNTNCTCAACRGIQELDLKCVAHYGQYVPQQAPTGIKLLGPDIILSHRLLKNTIIDETGIQAYAFLSESFVAKFTDAQMEKFRVVHSETYDSLGTVNGRVIDLNAAVDRFIESERCLVTAEDADVEINVVLPASPSLLWPYFIDAGRRLAWQTDTTSVENRVGEDGRTGVGTVSYCDHGNYRMEHRIVDWRPFDYITMQTESKGNSLSKPPSGHVTFAFEPLDDGNTALSMRIRTRNRGIAMRLMLRLLKSVIVKEWRRHYERLDALIRADLALTESELHIEAA